MKLSRYSDYALRMCLYLAANPERVISISEIVDAYGLPKGNIMKLATDLVRADVLQSVRGRTGGLKLAHPASETTVGQIVRFTEGNQPMVDCSNCPIAKGCGLICILKEAQDAFFLVLDRYSLQTVQETSPGFLQLLFAENTDVTG